MIGYYVHHHGQGHLQRMTAIAAHLGEPMTVLSSLPPRPGNEMGWVHLPLDNTGSVFDEPTANGTLHWAPQHHPGLRKRMAMVAAWIAEADPSLVVVDVSVEVASLCRLLGVPTVVMAMRGDRTDRPHRQAYDGAHALIATWTEEFADREWPKAWRAKTFHAGPISRFAPRPAEPAAPSTTSTARAEKVLVLWGSGAVHNSAEQFTPEGFAAAVSATPNRTWRFAGGDGDHRVSAAEVWDLLAWADVVVTHAGQNAVAEVAASRTPAVVIADARPHGEQHETATILHRAGLAIGLHKWPGHDSWPTILDEATALGGDGWIRWSPPDAARRTAEFLRNLAVTVRAGASGPDCAEVVA